MYPTNTSEPSSNRIVEVRASSWGRLFDCAYAWEGEQLLGLRTPNTIRPALGTAVHASTAAFDEARMRGAAISASDAADVLIDTLHSQDVDEAYDTSLSMREAEVIGLRLHTRYCTEISPRYEFKAVEMKMNAVDIDLDGVTIRLKGMMDRARVARTEKDIDANGNIIGTRTRTVIPDIKTGGRLIAYGAVLLKGRSAQLGAYQIMYEQNTGEQTDGAQIIALQTTAAAPVGVSRVFDAKRAMLGTPYEPGLVEFAATMFKTGHFPPNPQSSLCSEKFCARWASCIYHD
jgi:hypothetical protein